jgi:soluble lytic murein transglycosylase-like protein
VDAGVRHLKDLLTSFNGDVRLSLAAYNAGANAVARANGIPRFPETRSYVNQITNLMGNPNAWFLAASSTIRTYRNEKGILTIAND